MCASLEQKNRKTYWIIWVIKTEIDDKVNVEGLYSLVWGEGLSHDFTTLPLAIGNLCTIQTIPPWGTTVHHLYLSTGGLPIGCTQRYLQVNTWVKRGNEHNV